MTDILQLCAEIEADTAREATLVREEADQVGPMSEEEIAAALHEISDRRRAMVEELAAAAIPSQAAAAAVARAALAVSLDYDDDELGCQLAWFCTRYLAELG